MIVKASFQGLNPPHREGDELNDSSAHCSAIRLCGRVQRTCCTNDFKPAC